MSQTGAASRMFSDNDSAAAAGAELLAYRNTQCVASSHYDRQTHHTVGRSNYDVHLVHMPLSMSIPGKYQRCYYLVPNLIPLLTLAPARATNTIPTTHTHPTRQRLNHSIPLTPVNSVLTTIGPSARPTHMANCTSPLLRPSEDEGAWRLVRSMLRMYGMAPIFERARSIRRPVQMSTDEVAPNTALELEGG